MCKTIIKPILSRQLYIQQSTKLLTIDKKFFTNRNPKPHLRSQKQEIQVKLKLKDIKESKSILKNPSPPAILKTPIEDVKSMIRKKLEKNGTKNGETQKETYLLNNRQGTYTKMHLKI